MSLSRPHFLRDATDVPHPTPVTRRHLVSATDRLIALLCDADLNSGLRANVNLHALNNAAGSTR